MNASNPDITAEPLFRIEPAGADGREIAPRSADELEKWLDKEAQAWGWLRVPVNGEQPYKAIRVKQFFAEDEIRQNLALVKSDPSNRGAWD